TLEPCRDHLMRFVVHGVRIAGSVFVVDVRFLHSLKAKTESRWAERELEAVYAFQIQQGTRWKPGLTPEQIRDYEQDVGFEFTPELRLFLSVLNGFDRPGLNVYAFSGIPPIERVICYSYPRDLELVREMIARVEMVQDEILPDLQEATSRIWTRPVRFMPIYAHRFVVCPPNPGVVCSIMDDDAIVFADDLKSYLIDELLDGGSLD
ncbi:MAG: hypothetical protein ACF8LL_11235, partial [Phycisphaerales bacterium]